MSLMVLLLPYELSRGILLNGLFLLFINNLCVVHPSGDETRVTSSQGWSSDCHFIMGAPFPDPRPHPTGGATPRSWTPTTPPTNCWPKAPRGGGGGGGGLEGGV